MQPRAPALNELHRRLIEPAKINFRSTNLHIWISFPPMKNPFAALKSLGCNLLIRRLTAFIAPLLAAAYLLCRLLTFKLD